MERLNRLPEPGVTPVTQEQREAPAVLGDDFVSGVRVAELSSLKTGNHVIRAQLVAPDGTVALERLALVTVRANTVATIVLTRDCRSVTCPMTADDPASTACLGGRCVRPTCLPEQPETCPAAVCQDTTDCPGGNLACEEPTCAAGVCLLAGNHTLCGGGEACVPERGCVPVPGQTGDGSTPMTDAGPGDSGPTSDGGPTSDAGAGDAGAAAGNLAWVKHITMPAGGGDPADLVVDADGTVLLGGFFGGGAIGGTVSFGGAVPDLTAVDNTDGFVARHDAAGTPLFARAIPGTGNEFVTGIDVNPNGDIVVAGRFSGTVTTGSGDLTATGTLDTFVAQLGSDGSPQWGQAITGTGITYGSDVAVDGLGNVYITGRFDTAIDTGISMLTPVGSTDAFVVSYTSGGAPRWARVLGSSVAASGYSIAVNDAGDVFVTGTFEGNVSVGPDMLVGNGSNDVMLVSYTEAGAPRFARSLGGAGADSGLSVALAPGGRTLLAGTFRETVDFGFGAVTSAGVSDGFILAMDAGGNALWARTFGNTASDSAVDVASDPSGNVHVTGGFSLDVDLGLGVLTGSDGQHGFLASYGPDGTPRWALPFGTPGLIEYTAGLSVAADSDGVYAAFLFIRTADFGTGPLMQTGNTSDVVLLKLE